MNKKSWKDTICKSNFVKVSRNKSKKNIDRKLKRKLTF